MPRFHAPDQHVTATGIRIVGKAATELVAQAASLQLEPPEANQVLWVARFRARPRLGGGSAVPALLDAVGTVLQADWDAAPPVTRDTPFSRPAGRFHGIRWETSGEPGAWRGELVWRHRHPILAGTPLTTHLLIDEQQHLTQLTLAAAVEGGIAGVRGIVGAGQSRPPLLDALRRAAHLTTHGADDQPRLLAEREVEPFVREVLLSEERTWPVAVLAPTEGDGFLVPPDDLARELFGLAPLYVLERHACTFRLTDAVGDRRLSAYWGALRIYRPEFSCADRSDDHWLLMRDRVDDPLERAAVFGRVAQSVAPALLPIEGIHARRDPRRDAEAAARRAPASVAPESPAPPIGDAASGVIPPASPSVATDPGVLEALGALPPAVAALTAQLRDLSGTIAHLVRANAQLADEVARLRTTTAIRATSSTAIERRLGSLESLLAPPDTDGELAAPGAEQDGSDEGEARVRLVDVVRHAASEFGDALLILDSAEAAALDSPYEDPDRVAVILQAMAYVARRRQEGGLDTGLRAAFQELGVDYRPGIAKSTSDRLRQQYLFVAPDGRQHECLEHIAIGATYDPRRCLRIYFTSRAPSEPRFVIGHVGRHLRVMTST